jgi:DNA-binding LacI/PurR family transcriptional regulator
LPRVVSDRACDGILVLGDLVGATAEQVKTLAAFPCITMIHRDHRFSACDEVLCDDYSVARLAVETLQQAGATQYAFYNARPDHSACRERRIFFDFHLAQNELRAQHFVAELKESLAEPAHVVADKLVKRLAAAPQRPDGLFVPMDCQLPELYTALRDHGIEPEKDIKLASCDNCERHLVKVDPRPSSIDLHWPGIGWYAARQLIWRIEHPDADAVRLLVKPHVVAGNKS